MKLYQFVIPTALAAALAMGAAPVEAASSHGGDGSRARQTSGFHAGGHASGFHSGGHVRFQSAPQWHGPRVIHDNHFQHRFVNGFGFRPRVGVGFGVFLGYPFGYPYYQPWAYWDYPVGPLAYVPGQGYGGVSFSIQPGDAGVTVDGAYAGTVDEFDNPQYPLNLPPGQHHIQIQAPGYSTLDFTVNVQAGEVLPYAGELQHN